MRKYYSRWGLCNKKTGNPDDHGLDLVGSDWLSG
jgi:hypothetical protein